ncbi:hypothetical protein [Saccharomonospora piscinae]|nr:hypothetical protein [Saccharomonospora piscinae]
MLQHVAGEVGHGLSRGSHGARVVGGGVGEMGELADDLLDTLLK